AQQRSQTLLNGIELSGRLASGLERGQLPDQPLVLEKSEPGLRIGQRGERQIMLNVSPLGFLAPQELPAGWQIVKQLPHFDACARRMSGGLDFKKFPPVNDDLSAFRRIIVAFPRGERET